MKSYLMQLDNPVWHALGTTQHALGIASPNARRYQPDVAPFAAIGVSTTEAFQELSNLLQGNDHVIVQSLTTLSAATVLKVTRLGSVLQMIAPSLPSGDHSAEVLRLGTADLEDMLRLSEATRPGPFARGALSLGNYVGIRYQGQLIAMAGERMRLDGFVEISAVCVDDAHRGKGLAGRLMNGLRREILLRGDIPFLHVLSDNAPAVSLYRRLGFEDRKTFELYRLERDHSRH